MSSVIEDAVNAAEALKGEATPRKLADADYRTEIFPRIRAFRFQCQQAILSAPQLAVEKALPELLWRVGFYKLVEFYRQRRSRNPKETDDLTPDFQLILAEGAGFYINFVHQLQQCFHLVPTTPPALPFGFTQQNMPHFPRPVNASSHAALLIVHSSLIHAGDLARYAGQAAARARKKQSTGGAGVDEKAVQFGVARRHYTSALHMLPGNGSAYNQLAVLVTYDRDFFTAGYYYIRNLCARESFSSPVENLTKLFRIIADTAQDIVDDEDDDNDDDDDVNMSESDDDDEDEDDDDDDGDDDGGGNGGGNGDLPGRPRRLLPGQRGDTRAAKQNTHSRTKDLTAAHMHTVLHQFAYLHTCLFFNKGFDGLLWRAWRPANARVFTRLARIIKQCALRNHPHTAQQQPPVACATADNDPSTNTMLPLQLLSYSLFSVEHTRANAPDRFCTALELLFDLVNVFVSLEAEMSTACTLGPIKIASNWLQANARAVVPLLRCSSDDPAAPHSSLHITHTFWKAFASLATRHAQHTPPQPEALMQWRQPSANALPEDVAMLGFSPLTTHPFFADLELPRVEMRTGPETAAAVHNRAVVAAAVALSNMAGAPTPDDTPSPSPPPLWCEVTGNVLTFQATVDASQRLLSAQPHVSVDTAGPAAYRHDDGGDQYHAHQQQYHDAMDNDEDDISNSELYGVMESIMAALDDDDNDHMQDQ
ncbi:hypothetical protein PTSG_12246 [Salpingoeca rosetta]|uniref:DNA/RNA-binding domain-containing protein n=1 Tax=Salpingoeca rosetta (strain ATCC 50818 / BSB-021) TaxID=946362 RepID=F2U9C5_SALR5|nr:uncharacterized protein PTSG_12246 [Salpingoeca rosetta]EGD73328.1 hypothetical protein PTSG_12246 [Salpingoeca rosetta]|eukprot:XP_004994358.1 hypothetical protein PTSG_12246 [Salpingoeca rosetta]